ncbi:MAG: hypothetical protein DBW85_01580 [Synechococcus sp. MED-G71]|jgi:hypothetical protein|nr:MAG: hypothetical protein DBW85_01580 [Synechococcus sp. MED-G71]|tara:strand:- start:2003 stop:2365 length:363 start_codon:yes stop_codon:yes gene_type:complete
MQITPVVLAVVALAPAAAAVPLEAATDLALGYCLHAEGHATQMQSYRFVQELGRRQGWPAGWTSSIRPNQIQRAIGQAGGCHGLLQQAGSGGQPRARPTAALPQPRSRSAAEGFGLAPYR